MRVALHLNSYAHDPANIASRLAEIAVRADQADLSALALMDHFLHPGPQPKSDPVLEGYTTLGFLAAKTQAVDLMLLVSGVHHRHPVLLAKAVTSVDVLSGGRARLGIGAGWFTAENDAYGLTFPSTGERFTQLRESVEIIRHLWSEGEGPFRGERFELASTAFAPSPLRKPHPPIVIGGNGRQQTLRLAATYADGCNILAGPTMGGVDEARSLIETLHEHCAGVDRAVDEIALSMLFTAPIDTSPDGVASFAAQMREYAALGISEVFVMPLGQPNVLAFVDALGAKIVPAVTDETRDLFP